MLEKTISALRLINCIYHFMFSVVVLIIVGFFISSLPLAGVGMTCTGPYDVN